jgi:hypothetical protein
MIVGDLVAVFSQNDRNMGRNEASQNSGEQSHTAIAREDITNTATQTINLGKMNPCITKGEEFS